MMIIECPDCGKSFDAHEYEIDELDQDEKYWQSGEVWCECPHCEVPITVYENGTIECRSRY